MSLLTLGGTDIRDRTGIFLDLVAGFFEPAAVRGSDTIIPSATGQVARSRKKHSRTVRLDGYVTGSSGSDASTNLLALQALLDATALQDLVVDDGYLGTTATWTLSVRCQAPSVVGPFLYALAQPYASVSVEFVSVTPEWAAS